MDDARADDTGEFLGRYYPEVVLLENEENRGFAETINRGFRTARHEIVLALNNDIVVGEDLFAELFPADSTTRTSSASPRT